MHVTLGFLRLKPHNRNVADELRRYIRNNISTIVPFPVVTSAACLSVRQVDADGPATFGPRKKWCYRCAHYPLRTAKSLIKRQEFSEFYSSSLVLGTLLSFSTSTFLWISHETDAQSMCPLAITAYSKGNNDLTSMLALSLAKYRSVLTSKPLWVMLCLIVAVVLLVVRLDGRLQTFCPDWICSTGV